MVNWKLRGGHADFGQNGKSFSANHSEVGFFHSIPAFYVRSRPTGPHPHRARELTTPPPPRSDRKSRVVWIMSTSPSAARTFFRATLTSAHFGHLAGKAYGWPSTTAADAGSSWHRRHTDGR